VNAYGVLKWRMGREPFLATNYNVPVILAPVYTAEIKFRIP